MTNEAGATPGLIVHSPGRPAAGLWPFGKPGGTGFCLMPLVFPISGIAAAAVGQTSRSARVLQDPLFAQRTQPYPRAKRPWRGRRPQEWSPAPRITQLAQNRKTSDIRLQPVSVASTASPASEMRTYVGG